MARSGQLATAFSTMPSSPAGTSGTGTSAFPSSLSANTSGQMSQQRAWPWQRSGSTVTFISPHPSSDRTVRERSDSARTQPNSSKVSAYFACAKPSSALGLTYLSILLLLIVFTNVRLRGVNSVVALLAVALAAVLISWLGWWDEIARLIPYLSVHMNTGFYLVFSTGLLIIWLMMFFVFDRLTYWRIRPGQMTVEHLIGGGAESFDTNGLHFQKLSSDFFRAALRLGAGDLRATASGQRGATIEIPNVTFVDAKSAA